MPAVLYKPLMELILCVLAASGSQRVREHIIMTNEGWYSEIYGYLNCTKFFIGLSSGERAQPDRLGGQAQL